MKYTPLLLVLTLAACASAPKPAEPDDSKYRAAIARLEARNAAEDAEADARIARTVELSDRIELGFNVLCGKACRAEPYWTLPGNLPIVTAPDMRAVPFHDTTVAQ